MSIDGEVVFITELGRFVVQQKTTSVGPGIEEAWDIVSRFTTELSAVQDAQTRAGSNPLVCYRVLKETRPND